MPGHGRDRDLGGDLPPEVSWPQGFDLSGRINQGLVIKLNSPWMEIIPGSPIPIKGNKRPVFAYTYDESGQTIQRFESERGYFITDQRGYDAAGLDLKWALRAWRRTLLLGSSIANSPDSELTEFPGLRDANFLRKHVQLLIPDPEAMIVRRPQR